MEQQYGAPGAAQAQAARTVLPGEPFDPPQASQVPGPRPAEPAAEVPAAPAPPTEWNYEQLPPPQGAASYGAAPTYVDPQQFGGGDFESLHDFATLPAASQFSAPAPATEAFSPAAYPPPPAPPVFAPAQPEAASYPPPVFAPAEDWLPPLPPVQDDEGLLADPDKKRGGRKSVDKRLIAVALVAVVAGGGYFGYTQLSKKSSTTPTGPVVPATAPAPKYNFPSNVAGLPLQSAASSAARKQVFVADAKAWNPTLAARASFASYSATEPAIVAMTFHPAPAQLAADYASLVRFSEKPDAGNVATAAHAAAPGAAGGQMVCGGESGSQTQSWCVFRGVSSIGVMVVTGSPKTQITEILTREMRAYAEH